MSKRDPKDRSHDKHERHGEHEREDRERGERSHGTGFGTEQKVYREYLARRWNGSNPPTPQAYSQAAKVWRQLPGAVVATASDLGSATPGAKHTPPSQRAKGPGKHKRG